MAKHSHYGRLLFPSLLVPAPRNDTLLKRYYFPLSKIHLDVIFFPYPLIKAVWCVFLAARTGMIRASITVTWFTLLFTLLRSWSAAKYAYLSFFETKDLFLAIYQPKKHLVTHRSHVLLLSFITIIPILRPIHQASTHFGLLDMPFTFSHYSAHCHSQHLIHHPPFPYHTNHVSTCFLLRCKYTFLPYLPPCRFLSTCDID